MQKCLINGNIKVHIFVQRGRQIQIKQISQTQMVLIATNEDLEMAIYASKYFMYFE